MAGKAKELEKEKEMKEKEKGPGATMGKEGGKEGEVGGFDKKDGEKMDESWSLGLLFLVSPILPNSNIFSPGISPNSPSPFKFL